MVITEDTKLLWQCTFGSKSHINLIGKIVLSPLILIFVGTWTILDVLFSKRDVAA